MKIKSEKVVTETHYKCDFCDRRTLRGYGVHEVCIVCHRDCCSKHSVYDPIQSMADRDGAVCVECWPKAKPYYEELDFLGEEYRESVLEIIKLMRMVCTGNDYIS